MTFHSESGVERDATAPEDDTRAHPTDKQFERTADQIAALIKERDEARDKIEVLERTAVLMTALLAEAEAERLEAKLELAKERAKQARQLVRDGKPLTTSRVVDVYLFETRKNEANGKDA